jgi:hypothetical protein
MSQNPALPKFEVPINDKGGATSKYWYFFFQGLLANTLSPSGVVPGSYTSTNLTVNEDGIITAASNGSGGGAITVTDGTHTVTPASQITFAGAVVSGATPNAVVTVSAGAGTVTSVALNDASTNPIYTISGSPVTTAGTLTETLNTQAANIVFAGPASGAAAQPAFRALQVTDIAAALSTIGFPTNNGLPGTIPTLVYWFDASALLAAQAFYPLATNQTPGFFIYSGYVLTGSMIINTLLNGLNVATLNGSSTYSLLPTPGGVTLNNSTIFVVIKTITTTGNPSIFGSTPNNAYELFINSSAQLSVVVQGAAIIGASTAALSSVNFVQANVTYNSTGGAFAFRQSRLAAGSGTSAHPVTIGSSGIFCAGTAAGSPSSPLNAQVAELIVYTSVLSGAQTTSIENYLFAKWGV